MAPTMYMCLFLVPGYHYTVSCRYIKFGRQKFNPSSVKSCAWYVLVFLNVPIATCHLIMIQVPFVVVLRQRLSESVRHEGMTIDDGRRPTDA